MSAALKQVIENIEELTSGEKALVAHCLISSLEIKHDESVDNAWAELAEKRFSEFEASYRAIMELPNTWSTFKKGFPKFLLSKFLFFSDLSF